MMTLKKSYTAILKEIEKMRADGLDDDTIKYTIQAKYNESNIEKIKTEANWEKEEKMEKLEQKNKQKKKTEEFWGKAKPYLTLIGIIVGFLFYIFIVGPAVDWVFELMESIVE
jgi:hypothetical protein